MSYFLPLKPCRDSILIRLGRQRESQAVELRYGRQTGMDLGGRTKAVTQVAIDGRARNSAKRMMVRKKRTY